MTFERKNSYDHLQNTSDTTGIPIQNAKANKNFFNQNKTSI